MPNRKYIVRLSCDERKHLQDLVSKGRTQAYRIRHAHILMKADADGPCWGDEAIAQAFSCHRRTAGKVFVSALCSKGSTQPLSGRSENDRPSNRFWTAKRKLA